MIIGAVCRWREASMSWPGYIDVRFERVVAFGSLEKRHYW
jgi:hypothetical protein